MNYNLLIVAGTLVVSSVAANERKVEITSNVTASYVNNDSETGNSSNPDNPFVSRSDTLSIQPSIGASYRSNRFLGRVSATHNYLDRHTTSDSLEASTRDNYTNYTASSELQLIENVFSISLGGQQGYQSFGARNSLIDDQFTNSANLSRTRRLSTGFNFSAPQSDYIALFVQGSFSNTKSNSESFESANNIDSDNKSLVTRITQGDEVDFMSWDISHNYRKTQGSLNTDLLTRSLNGNIYFGLTQNFDLLVTGRSETVNRSSTNDFSDANDLDYDSYGAGLSYAPASGRRLDISYNESNRQLDDEKDKFVGVNLNWRFTSRSSLSAELSRRFFGESGSLLFRHNTKAVRTSIRYDENVTTFSRIIGLDQDVQVFVCPVGVTDIGNCFQPDTLSYELETGEEFVPFASITPELSEEVRVRKTLQGTMGFQRRRLTTNLNVRHISNDFLDTGREIDTYLIGIASSLRFGTKTSFSLSADYQDTKDVNEGAETTSDTWRASVGLNYRMAKDATIGLTYRYVKRDSDDVGEDVTNKRLSLRFSYVFN